MDIDFSSPIHAFCTIQEKFVGQIRDIGKKPQKAGSQNALFSDFKKLYVSIIDLCK